ncbi:MAG: hypothetical protein IKH18_00165 [Clostridia bacterium]|nr:hypothetical protein [Clostridia bacterium]
MNNEKEINMENERKIQLTVVSPQEDENEIRLDLYQIGSGFRRFLALWLALAVIVGLLGTGIGLFARKNAGANTVNTLIDHSLTTGISSRLDLSESMEGIRSSATVSAAMTELGYELKNLNTVRNCLTVTGVMPDEAYDQMTLYYNLLSKNNANTQTVQSLLATNSVTTRYIVAFRYKEAGYTQEEGARLLDAIVGKYRTAFDQKYNTNAALGNPIAAVDYTEYDYPEAVSVFKSMLKNIRNYLQRARNSQKTVFRSEKTGYTLQDLQEQADLLKKVDLNRISSYIDINSITKKEREEANIYYEWLIREQQRQKDVLEARYKSLSDSVKAYEKDPEVFAGTGSRNNEKAASIILDRDERAKYPNYEDNLNVYDAMILEMLDTQEQISEYNTTIRYYESVREKLNGSEKILQDNIDTAESYLEDFNRRVTGLVDDVNRTVTEYSDRAVKANAVKVLVPATSNSPKLTDGGWVKYIIIAEGLLFVCYIAAVVIYGLKMSNRRKEA